MSWSLNVYALVQLASGIIGLGLAAVGWSRRHGGGGGAFSLLMLAVSWWSFCGAIEASVTDIAAKVLSAKFQYISIPSIAVLWLLFALARGPRRKRLPNWAVAALWLVPMTILVLAFTNERHSLIWTAVRPLTPQPGAFLVYEHGPAVWVNLVYSYVLVLLATGVLIRDAVRRTGLLRRQTAWLLAGAAFPWLGNLAYMFRIGPPALDWTPLAFTAGGACLAVSLLRYRLLDVVPIAHDELFAGMADSVLVLDGANRILDLNPAARRLLGAPADVVGTSLLDLLAPWPDFAALAPGLLARSGESVIRCPIIQRWLDVRISDLRGPRGEAGGRLVVLRDITPLKAAEEERVAALERIGRQQQTVVLLAADPAIVAGNFEAAAPILTEAAGTAMQVERTSLWLGSFEEGRIVCRDLFERTPARHSGGGGLEAGLYPRYFEALAGGRVIDASDAAADPRTSEFRDDYLVPQGITSLLDAPIRTGGRVRGIVCFEQVGPARAWRTDEIRFAGEIADQAAQALLAAERREAAEALRRREERLSFITDNQLDMICQLDLSGTALFVSPSIERVLGYSFREMLGHKAAEFVHPDDFPALAGELEAARREGRRALRFEYRFRHADGSFPWLESAVLLYDDAEGRPAGSIVSSRDVTQRRRAEEALRETLREKDVVLKELHHRVRNNLQVISSLLNLQARALPEPALREPFRETQNRIKALALVHEKMHRAPDLARIDFADYAESVVVHLYHALQADAGRIRFAPAMQKIEMDIGLCIPLGLIVNELVSNALCHAFPGDRRGTLEVRLERLEGGRARLAVRDDGVGWTVVPSTDGPESLGLQIVRTLAQQIKGTLAFGSEGGASVELTFPLPD